MDGCHDAAGMRVVREVELMSPCACVGVLAHFLVRPPSSSLLHIPFSLLCAWLSPLRSCINSVFT